MHALTNNQTKTPCFVIKINNKAGILLHTDRHTSKTPEFRKEKTKKLHNPFFCQITYNEESLAIIFTNHFAREAR